MSSERASDAAAGGVIDPQRRAVWAANQQRARQAGLALKPDFAEVAERWEAWWRFEADRPILIAEVRDGAGIRWDKAFDLFDEPACWLEVNRTQIEHTRAFDGALPGIRIDFGPVFTAALLGAPLKLAVEENTTWQEPCIDDWDAVDLDAFRRIDPSNPWWSTMLELAEATAADAAGRYMLRQPDFTGAIDALANMRGPENLLMDLYDAPAKVKAAAEAVVEAWGQAFAVFHDVAAKHGAAVDTWLRAWSGVPYTVPTCDFNFSIGEGQFREFCLPTLARQCAEARRGMFHLDGPGAAKHAPALAESPQITAVQYTPGAATPRATEKLSMYRMLQAAGKPVLVVCEADEVGEMARSLDRRGLALMVTGVKREADAEAMLAEVCAAG